jgi:hypothetical protein
VEVAPDARREAKPPFPIHVQAVLSEEHCVLLPAVVYPLAADICLIVHIR